MTERLMRRGLFALLTTVIWAVPAGAAGAASPPGACHPDWSVVAHHAGGAQATPPAGSAAPVACAAETGYASSEPTVVTTNTGTILYSPAHTENSLTRSLDRGATWQLTYPQAMQYTSLWNTVDPYLAVDRTTGRVFWLRATGDLRTAPLLVDESPLGWQASTAIAYAHGFQVYSSADEGATWLTADYQHEFTGDWEKIFVGPPRPASSGAPQPSGYASVVYVCANAPFEVSGPGRDCYRSLDGGATFALAGYVYPSPTTPDLCPALAGNTGVVASDGTTYQPVSCHGGAYVAVSRDEGATYEWRRVPAAPPANGLSGPLQIAIDSADNLYAMWLADDTLNLSISKDGAGSWSDPLKIAAPGVHQLAVPVVAAGAVGSVAVAYYGSPEASPKALNAYITQTNDALGADPLFYSGILNDPAHPVFHNYDFSATPRTDYVGGSYDGAGRFTAAMVKQLGPPDSHSRLPTTGYLGWLESSPQAACAQAARVHAGSARRVERTRPHAPLPPRSAVSCRRASHGGAFRQRMGRGAARGARLRH
jgi:hypothetical protein